MKPLYQNYRLIIPFALAWLFQSCSHPTRKELLQRIELLEKNIVPIEQVDSVAKANRPKDIDPIFVYHEVVAVKFITKPENADKYLIEKGVFEREGWKALSNDDLIKRLRSTTEVATNTNEEFDWETGTYYPIAVHNNVVKVRASRQIIKDGGNPVVINSIQFP